LQYSRIFYVDDIDILRDVFWDTAAGKWQPGNLAKLEIKVPDGHHIAATSWGEGAKAQVRLFYQNLQKEIRILMYPAQEEWYHEPHPLTSPLPVITWIAAGHKQARYLHRKVPFFFYTSEDSEDRANNTSVSDIDRDERVRHVYMIREDEMSPNQWYGKHIIISTFTSSVPLYYRATN
jgi:hypothetical protein